MKDQERFSCFQFAETRTGIGQMVAFTCPPDTLEKVREFLQTNVRSIETPTTGRVKVIGHGSYGQYTRYDITQHDYAGGGSGYIEVLEIKNPPDGRCSIVINERKGPGGVTFTEWETLECARAAFKKFWGSNGTEEKFPNLAGFRRRVTCGELTPWFYAIGDQQLVGDYTFPEGLQDDAVYRSGRQFVIFDDNDIPTVKTCMGTRFVKRGQNSFRDNEQPYRLVYWDDGSVWDESEGRGASPRPIEEGEMWVTEAVQQFKQLLAGKSTTFTINFTDGNTFVGKLAKTSSRIHCAEGDYFIIVQLKGEKKRLEGWVNDFKPTTEAPDIVQYVTQRYAERGNQVEYIKIVENRARSGGKKWSGVFFNPPR